MVVLLPSLTLSSRFAHFVAAIANGEARVVERHQ